MISKRACALLATSLLASGCGGDDTTVGPATVNPVDGGGSETSSTAAIKIVSFTSAAPMVDFGGTTALSWQVEGAPDDVTLEGVSVAGKTTLPVSPLRRQIFTLRAVKAGAVVASATVSVAARGIDVLAGDPRGASNFDGAGNVAGFYAPTGVALDAAGNAYVADAQNREIRKVAPDGTVTTLAGNPHAPRESVDGTGSAAHFYSPNSIAVHPSGYLLVTDSVAHVVRKVMLADGAVTTIAGAAGVVGTINAVGTAARFSAPTGILLLPSGDALITDQGNCAIRKMATDLTVTTAYGVIGSCGQTNTAPAKFLTPGDIARDSAGNLYVTDYCVLRKITPGGIVTTHAGGAGCGQQNGDRTAQALFDVLLGVAVDATDNIYLTDSGNRTVRKIAGTAVTTLAGSKTAIGDSDGPADFNGFMRPQRVVTRPNGEVLVTDSYGNTVRAITPAGAMTTLAGTHPETGSLDGPVGRSRFGSPNGLTVDADGTVVVADLGAAFIGSVRRISREGVTSTLAGGGGATGFLDGNGADARFASPLGLTGDKKGTYFVSEVGSSTIRRVDPDGKVTTIGGLPGVYTNLDGAKGTGTFAAPSDVARDSKGNIYAVQYGAGIRKLAPDGTVSTVAGITPGDGYLDGNVSVAKFNSPRAIGIDAADNLYIADAANFVIRKITQAGVVSTIAGTPMAPGYVDGPGNTAKFGYVFGLVVDAKGNVFASDYDSDAIRKIAPDGTVTTIVGTRGVRGNRAGALPGTLIGPKNIAFTPDGDLVVSTSNVVMQITAP
ncbi:MAG: repeat containing protein [Myxococcaceae bacterium]|nr:repeat containing protein [Myxococcaceae bacterium]